MTPTRKRRKPGEGAVYRRPNGTWAGDIDLGTDQHGKRRRRTVYGKTEREVLGKLTELRRQLDAHGDLPTADMRLGKWLDYWLDEIAAKRVKPSTLVSYKTAVEQYLKGSGLGQRPLSRITPVHIREMHRFVIDGGRSSTTAHNAHRILAAALNDAVREGRVGRNVAALVRAPAKAPSKRANLTWDEARAILTAAAADERNAARWLAAFTLGARQGELLGMRWDYVDLDLGGVDLAWSLQRVAYAHGPACGCPAKTPTRRCLTKVLPIPAGAPFEQLYGNLCLLRPKSRTSQRALPLPRVLWEALKLHQEQQAREAVDYKANHRLVWCHPDGQPINPHDDWLTWRALLKTAGIKRPITLHEARHSTATWLMEGKVDDAVIRDLLGHSDVLTQRSYQHVSGAATRAALDMIGDRLALPEGDS